MQQKRFSKNDDGFVCQNCGHHVAPLGYSSRNHCPRCLCSLHVDENPGDRACECRGIMDPIRVETDPRKGYIVVHKCRACGAVKRNRAAHTATDDPDDLSLLIRLTVAN